MVESKCVHLDPAVDASITGLARVKHRFLAAVAVSEFGHQLDHQMFEKRGRLAPDDVAYVLVGKGAGRPVSRKVHSMKPSRLGEQQVRREVGMTWVVSLSTDLRQRPQRHCISGSAKFVWTMVLSHGTIFP